MNKIIKSIVFDIFYLLIGAYVFLIFLENLKPGLVSNYLDLNKLLYILIPWAVFSILISNRKTPKNNINNEKVIDNLEKNDLENIK